MSRVKIDIQKMYTIPFAKRLRELIEAKGISQTELSAIVGVTRQAISSYTLGNTLPNSDVLIKLAEFFDVSADYLLGLSEQPTTDKDINYICEYTGLDLQCVELLGTPWGKQTLELLNFLLGDNMIQFVALCTKFYTCKKLAGQLQEFQIDFLNNKDKYCYDSKSTNAYLKKYQEVKDKLDLEKYRLTNEFTELLNAYINEDLSTNCELEYKITKLLSQYSLEEQEKSIKHGNDSEKK